MPQSRNGTEQIGQYLIQLSVTNKYCSQTKYQWGFLIGRARAQAQLENGSSGACRSSL